MSFTDDFKHILLKHNNVRNANMFVFKNSSPGMMKVFPETVSSVLLKK